MNAEVKKIKQVIKNWETSVQNKDMNGILARHSKDILMFDVPEPLQSKGIDEYRKTWELFFQYCSGGKNSFQLDDLQIHCGDTIAFCTALIRMNGSKTPQCRLTIGFKKINGEWTIIHEHHSAPHKIV
jgi:ketosteroid isomerase-like protein